MSRIPKYLRYRAYEWYAKMFDLGLMYHPEDSPDDIVGDSVGSTLFTAEECVELNAISKLIWEDYKDPCGVACQVMIDRGEMESSEEN